MHHKITIASDVNPCDFAYLNTTHLENKEIMEKSGKNDFFLGNIFKNVDIAHFISRFYQRMSVISDTFC